MNKVSILLRSIFVLAKCMKIITSKPIPTIRNKQQLKFKVRPNTSDEKVVAEVINKNVYQRKKLNFLIEPSDVWLDLGANIGTFSCLVLSQGARVVSYEPEPNNFKLLQDNVQRCKKQFNSKPGSAKLIKQGVSTKNGTTKLYLTKSETDKYRHTIIPRPNRKTIAIKVVTLDKMLQQHPQVNAIKMDIEGIEIPILEQFTNWKKYNIKKLVFEYSFDFDRSIPRFLNVISQLKKYFDVVKFGSFDTTKEFYIWYPPSQIVHCTFTTSSQDARSIKQ